MTAHGSLRCRRAGKANTSATEMFNADGWSLATLLAAASIYTVSIVGVVLHECVMAAGPLPRLPPPGQQCSTARLATQLSGAGGGLA